MKIKRALTKVRHAKTFDIGKDHEDKIRKRAPIIPMHMIEKALIIPEQHPNDNKAKLPEPKRKIWANPFKKKKGRRKKKKKRGKRRRR